MTQEEWDKIPLDPNRPRICADDTLEKVRRMILGPEIVDMPELVRMYHPEGNGGGG